MTPQDTGLKQAMQLTSSHRLWLQAQEQHRAAAWATEVMQEPEQEKGVGLFQQPGPTQTKTKLAPFSHPVPTRQYPKPGRERNTPGCQGVLKGGPAGGVPESDGEVGGTDRPHAQPRVCPGQGRYTQRGQVQSPKLTLVSQRQRTVEVALLCHPRCVTGLVGHPAGTHAGHSDGCGGGGRRESQPATVLHPSLPHHRDLGLAAPRGAGAQANQQVACDLRRIPPIHPRSCGTPREPQQ